MSSLRSARPGAYAATPLARSGSLGRLLFADSVRYACQGLSPLDLRWPTAWINADGYLAGQRLNPHDKKSKARQRSAAPVELADRSPAGTPQVVTILTGDFVCGPDYQAWRPTGTDDWLIMATYGGAGRVGYDTGEIIVTAGEVVALEPHALHDYGTAENPGVWQFVWAHVHARASWLELLSWPEVAPGLRRLQLPDGRLRARVHERLIDMHHLATGSEPRRIELAMNALEAALLWCDSASPMRPQRDPRVVAVLEHCGRHLAERLTLADLARVAELSSSRLSFLFERAVGLPPLRWLEQQRMTRAAELLARTTTPVQDIAAEVGFADPFYFSQRFRRFSGVSPRAWRARSTPR